MQGTVNRSFDYTVDLERALLKIVTSNSMMCRMNIHRLKVDRFTSVERKLIAETALAVFNATQSLLTKTVFEYEVGSKVEASDRTYFLTEWALIEALDPKETPEVLIDKMEIAHLGRQTLDVSKKVTEYLEAGKVEDAVAYLKSGAVSLQSRQAARPTVDLTDIVARKQTIMDKRLHPEKYKGIKTGFHMFDKLTGGLFPGELTLFAGITGLGKSTLVRQLQKGIVTHPENGIKNVLHVANEEYLEQVQWKFDALFTEIPYVHFKQGSIDDADLEKWERIMGAWHHGLVFIKEVPAFTDVTLVEQAVRELEAKGIKIHAITIDHLPHVKPIQQAWGENDERFKAASDCKELARWLRLPVVVPTQAATIVEEKQSKGKPGGKLDVYGSKGQVHVANTFVLVTETGKDDTQTSLEDWERDVFWRCDCKKNRDGATFWFRAKHFVKIGKIVEVPKDGESGSAATAAAGAAALKEAKEAEKGSKQGKEGAKGSTPVSEAVPPPIAAPVADSAKLAQEVLKEEEARVASKSEAIPVESIVEAKQENVTVEKEPEPEHHLSTLDRLRKKDWRITPESKGGGV